MANVLRWVTGLLLAAIAVGGLGWAVGARLFTAMEEPDAPSREVAVAVEVADVTRGIIRDTRTFTGSLQARSRVDIAPRISGRIDELSVDIGDTIRRGDALAQLDNEEHQQNVQQAQADLLVAQATLEQRRSALGIAQRDLDRVTRLREQRIASESELDTASSRVQSEQAAVRVAEAEVARREAALRAAQVRLGYATIVAEWNTGGPERVVGERYIDEGSMISANEPIVSLLDLDTVLAVVYVNERDYAPLRLGMEAAITTQSNGGTQFTGEIVRMAPAFQEGSRQARVEIAIDNEAHELKPGMFVSVSLELGRADDAVIIPRQALLQRDGREGVFVVDQNASSVQFVPVQVGIRQRRVVQVVEPTLNGPVVVLGQHLLSDDAAVTIPQDDEASDAS